MYQRFEEAGFPQKKMSEYSNVIKPCLINPGDLSLQIGDVIPIPQLHCHIGIANWAWDWVKQVLGEERYPELLQWSRQRSISIRGYHGTGLDGNNSKNFFKASKDLHLLLDQETSVPIVDMLQKFDMVTKACFSRDLLPDWREVLERFITSVWELISFSKFQLKIKISIPWKLHLVVSHLRPFLEKTGRGMADYSEQTGESGHFKVDKEMSRFQRDLENPHHGGNMLAGCKRFNSKRF